MCYAEEAALLIGVVPRITKVVSIILVETRKLGTRGF